MQLAGASVALALVLLVVDELCAHPENSVRRAARELARQSARDAARAVGLVLCLPALAVCGIAAITGRAVREATLPIFQLQA